MTTHPPPAVTLTSASSPAINLTSNTPLAMNLTSILPPTKLVCHSHTLRGQFDLTSRKFAHNLMPQQEEMIRKALGLGAVDEVIVKGYGIVL